MNKKHLLIGTTAINRPILHSDIIKEWGDWVRKLDNSWSLAWFINVDYIESLGASYDETKENQKYSNSIQIVNNVIGKERFRI